VEDERVLVAGHLEDAYGALVKGAEEGVVHEGVAARHVELELDHRGAAGGDAGGLDVGLVDHRAALAVDPVEDLADDVEARREVGSTVAEEEADGLTDRGLQRVLARHRADAAVEDDVVRLLVDGLLEVEVLMALLVELAGGVELALHHVELLVHGGEALARLDEDEPVHAVGDVEPDGRGGAVVDVEDGLEGAELHRLCGAEAG